MKINIKATNIELTDTIREYIEKRIKSLAKYVDNSAVVVVRVNVGMETLHHQHGNVFKADINFDIPGKTLRAEASKDDLYAAIDEARDIIERQIDKYKKTSVSKMHRASLVYKKLKEFSPMDWLKRKSGK